MHSLGAGAYAAKGGEFGLMSVLMLHNHVPALIENQRQARWESLYSTPVAGRTLVIVGVGSIGGAVAARCKPLELRVIGVSKHGRAFAYTETDDVSRLMVHL